MQPAAFDRRVQKAWRGDRGRGEAASLALAKSQFTSEFSQVSMYFGRAFWKSR